MRIGIDASRANLRVRTGTEWYSFEIIKQLLARDHTNEYILYLKEAPIPELAQLSGRVQFRVLRWPPKFLWNLFRLSWEMLVHRPDVLFVPAHTIPLIHPKRLVTTCHDVGFERFPDLYARKPIGPQRGIGRSLFSLLTRLLTLGRYRNTELDYHRFSMRLALRRAERILVPSAFTADEIHYFYPRPKGELRIIHHGINTQFSTLPEEKERTALLRKHGIRKPYLFFLGRWEVKKNIDILLQSFERLRAAGRLEQLVLGGRPGLGFEEAWARISESTRSAIVLWENVTTEAPTLMAEAAVFVFPSAYEGFGLPILEAMSVGTPVVANAAASIPEIAGDAAILVEDVNPSTLSQAIHRVLVDASFRSVLIERGKARTSTFSWDVAGQATYEAVAHW